MFVLPELFSQISSLFHQICLIFPSSVFVRQICYFLFFDFVFPILFFPQIFFFASPIVCKHNQLANLIVFPNFLLHPQNCFFLQICYFLFPQICFCSLGFVFFSRSILFSIFFSQIFFSFPQIWVRGASGHCFLGLFRHHGDASSVGGFRVLENKVIIWYRKQGDCSV